MKHHLNFIELLVLANKESFLNAFPESDNGKNIKSLISEAEKHLMICAECTVKLSKGDQHYYNSANRGIS